MGENGRGSAVGKSRKERYYPWLIVLACFCIQGGVLGIVHCCRGMFFGSLTGYLQVDLSRLTVYVAVYGIASAAAMPAASWLLERFRLHRVLGTAAFFMAAVQFAHAFFTELWQWYAAGFIQGFCYAVLIPMTVPLLLQNWFVEKRGLVLGIAGMASGLFGAVFNAVGSFMISAWGWRFCYGFLGGFLFFLMVPVCLLVRKTPEDLGFSPYGKKKEERPSVSWGPSLKEAAHTVDFWLFLLVTAVICYLCCFNQMLSDFETEQAGFTAFAGMLTVAAMVGNIVTKLLVGRVNDKIGFYTAMFGGLFLIGGGFLFLLFGRSAGVLAGGAFTMGTPMALSVVLIPIWATNLFGRKHYATLYMVVSVVSNLFSSFGYLLFSGFHDLGGSYDAPLVFGAASCAAAAVMVWIVKRRQKR